MPTSPKEVKNLYTVDALNAMVEAKMPQEYNPEKEKKGNTNKLLSLFGGNKNGDS